MKVRTEVGWDGWIREVVVWMVVVMGMLRRHLDEKAVSGGVLDEFAAFLHLWSMRDGGR